MLQNQTTDLSSDPCTIKRVAAGRDVGLSTLRMRHPGTRQARAILYLRTVSLLDHVEFGYSMVLAPSITLLVQGLLTDAKELIMSAVLGVDESSTSLCIKDDFVGYGSASSE